MDHVQGLQAVNWKNWNALPEVHGQVGSKEGWLGGKQELAAGPRQSSSSSHLLLGKKVDFH